MFSKFLPMLSLPRAALVEAPMQVTCVSTDRSLAGTSGPVCCGHPGRAANVFPVWEGFCLTERCQRMPLAKLMTDGKAPVGNIWDCGVEQEFGVHDVPALLETNDRLGKDLCLRTLSGVRDRSTQITQDHANRQAERA